MIAVDLHKWMSSVGVDSLRSKKRDRLKGGDKVLWILNENVITS